MHVTPSTKRLGVPSPLLLFLLPSLLLIVVFFVVPIGITGLIRLTSLDYRFHWDFVGLANFFALWQDTLIPPVLFNTGVYVFRPDYFHGGHRVHTTRPAACGTCRWGHHVPDRPAHHSAPIALARHVCDDLPDAVAVGII